MKLSKALILVNAIVYLIYGVAFIFSPASMFQTITDGLPSTTSGMVDLRATYGGISTGYGLFLFYTLKRSEYVKLALLSIALIVAGMAVGRMTGIVLDGGANANMILYFWLEIAISSLAIVALYQRRRLAK